MTQEVLTGKIGLVFGVANKRSIAWAIAKAWAAAGARLIFNYQGERLKENVEELTGEFGEKTALFPCDVTSDHEIKAFFENVRSQTDRVPYDLWARDGQLETVPGKSIDYEYVARWLRELFDHYDIQKIGFDRWNYRHFKPWLLQAGFSDYQLEQRWIEFGQGTQSMSPALRELEQMICEKEIRHGNHPVLNMCAANAVVEMNDESNRKLSKKKSSGRIDGMVALAMAVGVKPMATKVDLSQRPFTVWTDDERVWKARTLIIATGASAATRSGCAACGRASRRASTTASRPGIRG